MSNDSYKAKILRGDKEVESSYHLQKDDALAWIMKQLENLPSTRATLWHPDGRTTEYAVNHVD